MLLQYIKIYSTYVLLIWCRFAAVVFLLQNFILLVTVSGCVYVACIHTVSLRKYKQNGAQRNVSFLFLASFFSWNPNDYWFNNHKRAWTKQYLLALLPQWHFLRAWRWARFLCDSSALAWTIGPFSISNSKPRWSFWFLHPHLLFCPFNSLADQQLGNCSWVVRSWLY